MKNKKYVEETFKKILKETLEEKANSIVGKINKSMDESKHSCDECGSQMYEGECTECGWKGGMEEGIYDVEAGVHFPKHQSFDYVEEEMNEERDNYNEKDAQKEMCKKIAMERPEELEFRNCGDFLEDGELDETLHGGQKKLDKNKNGRIDAEDFRMLRKSKKKETDEQWQALAEPAIAAATTWALDKAFGENNEEVEEGNAFTGALAKAKKEGDDEFEVDGKTYRVTEGNHFTGKLYKALEEGKDEFEVNGKIYPIHKHLRNKRKNMKKEDIQTGNIAGKTTMNEKWKGEVEVEKTGEYSDMNIEELNAAIKKLKAKNDKTKEAGKKVSDADRTKMSQLYFAKRAKQGWKGKGKAAVKESIQLTEDEMISLIERIVREQKENSGKNPVKMDNNLKGQPKPPGVTNTERALKGSKDENEKYYKEVTKKMKEYLKDGSLGDYEMNPKHFPAGNGELGEMKKKAYIPSDAVKDYVDNLTAAGQENLVYDEIHPNEEWVSKNIEGSSTTGNNPEWANSVETPTNKKRNQIRKNNLLGAIKKQAYHKADQPIVYDKSGDEIDGRHANLNFKKANKVMSQLESTEDKKSKVINEEMEKMKNLIGYSRKTQ
jgi:hypothetical protein